MDYSDWYCYYTHGSSIKYRMLKLLELFENNQQHPVDSRKPPFVEQSYPFFLLNYDDLSRMRFSSYNQKPLMISILLSQALIPRRDAFKPRSIVDCRNCVINI